MTVALKGAVIINEQRGQLQYRYKCDACGHVQPATVNAGSVTRGTVIRSSFKCTKCGASQQAELQGQ